MCNFYFKNEAKRADLQANKRILKRWPFWNKVYIFPVLETVHLFVLTFSHLSGFDGLLSTHIFGISCRCSYKPHTNKIIAHEKTFPERRLFVTIIKCLGRTRLIGNSAHCNSLMIQQCWMILDPFGQAFIFCSLASRNQR